MSVDLQQLPSNDDDDRIVLTVQSNEALGVALMSVLKSSLESLDSDPAAASRRTAHRIIGQAETHLTQLSELLAEPYEGDESSAMQPLVRRLLDAANAVIKPLFALHDVAKPNRCGQNQSRTDGPAAPNTSGPVGRWWNGIGPGESVRPNFVSANATADVKVSIQKLREAFGLLHHTSQGMQLKVATDGALSVGVVDPDDKNPDWEQVPTSLFVQASLVGRYLTTCIILLINKQAVVQMQCKRKTWGLVLDWDIACLIHQIGHRTYETGPIFHRSSLANRPSIFQVVATLLLDLSPLDQNVRPDWFVDLSAVYALTEVKPVPKLAPPAGSAGTETNPPRSTPSATHAGPEPTAMQPPDPPARNSLASFDLDAPAAVTRSTGMSHLPRATISGRSDGLPDGRMSHTSGVAGGTMGGGGTSRTQLPPTMTTPPRSWRILVSCHTSCHGLRADTVKAQSWPASVWPLPRSEPGDSTTVEEPDPIIGKRRLLPDMATIANPPDEHGDVLVGARHRFGDASLLAAVRDTRVLDREAAWDDSFLHQLASCLVPSALTVRSSARLQRDGATTIVGGPERAVPVTTIHTYRIEAVNTAQLCLGPSSQTERRRLTSPLIPPRSPVLPDVLELDHVDAMGHYTLTFCASLTRGNQSSLPVIAKITRPARYDMPPVDPFTAPAAAEQNDWDHQDDDNDGSYVSEDRAASREVVDELSNEIVMYRALGKCDDDLDPSSTVEATPATSSTTTAASVPTLRGAFVARPDRWKGCAMDLVILVTDDAGREVTPEEMARYGRVSFNLSLPCVPMFNVRPD